jgi:hypothetical protein
MVSCNGDPQAATTATVGPAPATKLKRKPRKRLEIKRGKRVKAKFRFKSDVADAGFQCTLDGKVRACSSPFKAKVKKGRHRFKVAATARGLTDFSPASFRFKATRRR